MVVAITVRGPELTGLSGPLTHRQVPCQPEVSLSSLIGFLVSRGTAIARQESIRPAAITAFPAGAVRCDHRRARCTTPKR
jgi:hypothetical protein